MKKIASILLLLVLLFNWVGYRIVADYLEQRANISLEQKLDKSEYDESQLIELKVALKLPYQSDWKDFERFDGEIEINGIHYKYVKRKVQNDSLVLLCLPNESKMKMQTARDNFFMLVNDLQHPSQNKKSDNGQTASVKNPVTEYYKENNNWLIQQPADLSHQFFLDNSPCYSMGYPKTPEQPPEA